MFRDADGRPVYVGKAKSLRKRVSSYFAKPQHPRTQAMLESATSVEWIVAGGEVDLCYGLPRLLGVASASGCHHWRGAPRRRGPDTGR